MSEEQRQKIDNEEEEKKVASMTDFHKTQMDMMKTREVYDPLAETRYDRRSNRVVKKS